MKKILMMLIACFIIFSSTACDVWNKSDKKVDSDGKWYEKFGEIKSDGKGEGKKPKKAESKFALNTEYLSFMGKPKSYIDEQCGKSGTYYGEFGLVDYGMGLMVGYNCLGNDMTPKSNDIAATLEISLDNLFLNCPGSVTYEQIQSVFKEVHSSYDEMNMENIIIANYNGQSICFRPDSSGLTQHSYASVSTDNYIAPVVTSSSLYYDYAVEHDSEFWEINKNWREDKKYYYLSDVDHDNQKELVVKVGCGIGVYKEVNGVVKQIFYNELPDSSGITVYNVCQYQGMDYIVYNLGNSSEYMKLNTVNNGNLTQVHESMVIDVDKYQIDGKSVFKSQYNKYKESIIYPEGMTIDNLK